MCFRAMEKKEKKKKKRGGGTLEVDQKPVFVEN